MFPILVDYYLPKDAKSQNKTLQINSNLNTTTNQTESSEHYLKTMVPIFSSPSYGLPLSSLIRSFLPFQHVN